MAELQIDDRFARRALWVPVAILGCFFVLLMRYAVSDDFCFAAM